MDTTSIALKSIGCRTNQEEIRSLGCRLSMDGYNIVNDYSEADIIIINTCSVTGATEAKTKRLINSFSKISPDIKILVTGCLAQQIPEELAKYEGVNWVVGNTCKEDIPEIIKKNNGGIWHSSLFDSTTPVTLFNNGVLKPCIIDKTRFSVKIQEGCKFRCSFCIVPILRGPSRSINHLDILRTIERAVNAGYKEIVVTGTHIGQYSDKNGYTLLDMIDDILTISNTFRVRLSSLDPRDCTENLLNRINKEPQLCKHIHVSIQSFSRDILKAMNREYKEYEALVERLTHFRKACPQAGIGGDFIVGFPGESDKMFETTVKIVKQVGFNYGHVFRFSARPGTTAAATIERKISEKEKTDRSRHLRDTLAALRKIFIQTQLNGIIHTIITEREMPVRGITSNYIRVDIPGFFAKHNSWQHVRLTEYHPEENRCTAVPFKENEYGIQACG